jgi:hypothetical protein
MADTVIKTAKLPRRDPRVRCADAEHRVVQDIEYLENGRRYLLKCPLLREIGRGGMGCVYLTNSRSPIRKPRSTRQTNRGVPAARHCRGNLDPRVGPETGAAS